MLECSENNNHEIHSINRSVSRSLCMSVCNSSEKTLNAICLQRVMNILEVRGVEVMFSLPEVIPMEMPPK